MTTPHQTPAAPAAPTRNEPMHESSVDDASDDAHWAPPRLSSVPSLTITEEASWDPEQLSKLQALMNVYGFEAAYLVNSAESTCSTIVGNRSKVTKSQIAMVCASLQVPEFDQLTFCLTKVHILVRHIPNLPDHACVMLIDRDQSNAAIAMNSLKKFCNTLT